METSLYIDLPKTSYHPGESMTGQVLWAFDRSPGIIRISLGWWTEGRGTKDAKIETELSWETAEVAGEESFRFQLPKTPYSFDGHLISLKWGLELTARDFDESRHLVEITLSPTGTPVLLPHIEDEGRGQSISFGDNR